MGIGMPSVIKPAPHRFVCGERLVIRPLREEEQACVMPGTREAPVDHEEAGCREQLPISRPGSAVVTRKLGQCLPTIRRKNEDFWRGFQVHLF